MRIIIILFAFAVSSVSAEVGNVYRISPECILEATIEDNAIVIPPARSNYQINVQLNEAEGVRFRLFTKSIIGSNLKVTNGFGETLNMPANRVVTEIGQNFRLAPYSSKEEARKVMQVLMRKGGQCGKA